MQPTDAEVTEVTVATQDLRQAGEYLIRHGWHQGGLFDQPGAVAPAASASGAIRMVVLGRPDWRAWWELPRHEFTRICVAESWLAAFLTVYGLTEVDRDADKAWLVVQHWNDRADTAAAHVIAALYGTAEVCQHSRDGGR